jgi:hypothetical protein
MEGWRKLKSGHRLKNIRTGKERPVSVPLYLPSVRWIKASDILWWILILHNSVTGAKRCFVRYWVQLQI